MSNEPFFVDTEGLNSSASGFHQRGERIRQLAARVRALTGHSVAVVIGTDKAGQAVFNQYRSDGESFYDGVHKWAKAVDNTGDTVTASAKAFAITEESNHEDATKFAKRLSTPAEVSGETTERVQGESTEPLYQGQVVQGAVAGEEPMRYARMSHRHQALAPQQPLLARSPNATEGQIFPAYQQQGQLVEGTTEPVVYGTMSRRHELSEPGQPLLPLSLNLVDGQEFPAYQQQGLLMEGMTPALQGIPASQYVGEEPLMYAQISPGQQLSEPVQPLLAQTEYVGQEFPAYQQQGLLVEGGVPLEPTSFSALEPALPGVPMGEYMGEQPVVYGRLEPLQALSEPLQAPLGERVEGEPLLQGRVVRNQAPPESA
jgi:hypothetical protein